MAAGLNVVSAEAVRRVLAEHPARVVDLVSDTYLRHGEGVTVNPPSHFLRFPDRPRDRIIALPAATPGAAGIKWISSVPANLERGLPRASAVLVLNDRETGFPLACLESSRISSARTAASAALAAVALGRGRPRVRRIGVVGAGLIARHVLDYLRVVGLTAEVHVFDHDPARAKRFAEDAGGHVRSSAEDVVRAGELVVFATTATTPHVTDAAWFDHHPVVLHVSLRDLSPEIVLGSVNVVDDVDHCLKADTSVHLAEQATGSREHVHATLADVLTGTYQPPVDRTVVFSPFGLGVLDIAVAEFVHARALADGTAHTVADFHAGLTPDGTTDAPAGPDLDLAALPISAEQADLAVRRAARRGGDVDFGETAVGALARRARSAPSATAVVTEAGEVSVAALARRVAAARQAITARGCRAGDVVACFGRRGVDTISLFLALESIGAVYLPLDTNWPAARLAEILRGSQARLAVDYCADVPALTEAATTAGVPVLTWSGRADGDADLARVLDEIGRERCADSAEPRYLYYTSGTTGTPKGALIEHRGMVNHVRAKIADLGLDESVRFGFTAPLVFDIAICQMVIPILLDGVAVVVDEVRMSLPRKLVAWLRATGTTVIEVVPTVAGWVADEVRRNPAAELPNLRWVVSTGEELRPAVAGRILNELGVRLLNAYGFTETSDDVAHHEVVAADLGGDRLPVGRAVLNCTLSVLVPEGDTWRAAAPDEPGELFVGGIPVGRGYPDDPAATRRAYFRDVLDPASPTGRLYRTGDAAVMTADGLLHCLGRLDRQAKISGVRIEPDEVEAVLSRHPKVTACAALVHRAGEAAELVACYVADEPATEDELRAHVASALPPAMVPTRWLRMEALPLSTNGKVDHHALTTALAGTRG